MNKLFLIIIVLILLLSTAFFVNKIDEVKIKNTIFQVEIADESNERQKGLSNRNYLCGNCAMLFVFEDSKPRTFVMREMMMPIDILFINNNIITDIYKDLEPEGKNYNNYYKSSSSANMVLEINANYSDRHDIKVGDEINIY
ncbi:MAG TPA: DUF192 domain-containing protein [Patescibacteria group bacterium]|nr:DUF192 domain-containing protein [Patescibacteria group bacterium]